MIAKMRLASAIAACATLASAQATACSCSIPPPIAGEGHEAYLIRRWTLYLDPARFNNVFMATVAENLGRHHAMTTRDGAWPVRLADVDVLAGRAPSDGVIHNNNSCWAHAPVGSKILVRTDDSFQVGLCTVDQLNEIPLDAINMVIRKKHPRPLTAE